MHLDKPGLLVALVGTFLTTSILVANSLQPSAQKPIAASTAIVTTPAPPNQSKRSIQIGQLPLVTTTPTPTIFSVTPFSTPGPTNASTTCGLDYSWTTDQEWANWFTSSFVKTATGPGSGPKCAASTQCIQYGFVSTLDACCVGSARANGEIIGYQQGGFVADSNGKLYRPGTPSSAGNNPGSKIVKYNYLCRG